MRTNYRNGFFCILCSMTLALIAFDSASAENWPCFRGPTRQGISHEKDVPVEWSQTSNILWKRPIPGEGWSSPIVFDDRVFVTTATDAGASFHLLCLDRLTGNILWDKQVLRQKPGHKQRFNSYASSTPVTDGQRVYVLACDGTLVAVSMGGGVIWTHREFEYFSEHGLAVSLILYKDLLIVPFDGSSSGPDNKVGWQKPWDQAVILALDKNTGKVRWKGRRGSSRIAHVTPQVLSEDGRDQLISSAGNVVQGFDLETGERIWTASSIGEGVVPSVVVGDGLVFTTSGFGESTIRAVRTSGRGDVTQTHIVWESVDDVPKVPSMLYVRGLLFLITESGVAKCLRAATGEAVWTERLGGRYSASPIWADGRIYFLSEKGKTTVVRAGPEFKVLAENELNEKCGASPAVSQKQIFIRSENNIYCIGRSKRTASLTPTHANVRYGPGERNVLDLYLAESAASAPLVLYIHGGGFRGGDKRSLNVSEARSYLDAGFSIAALNYRLTDTAPAPAAYMDCARALQFLRHNAEKWNINPRLVASTGGSAGAGTSMWLAFHDDLADVDSDDPIARESTRLTCIAVRNGQSSYDPRFAESIGIPRPNFERHPFFLAFYDIRTNEIDTPRAYRLYEQAAPITYVSKDDPPALLTYNYPNEQVTEKTSLGLIVHHPKFGIALRKRLGELGIECIVQYPDSRAGKLVRHGDTAAAITPAEFIREQFDRARQRR